MIRNKRPELAVKKDACVDGGGNVIAKKEHIEAIFTFSEDTKKFCVECENTVIDSEARVKFAEESKVKSEGLSLKLHEEINNFKLEIQKLKFEITSKETESNHYKERSEKVKDLLKLQGELADANFQILEFKQKAAQLEELKKKLIDFDIIKQKLAEVEEKAKEVDAARKNQIIFNGIKNELEQAKEQIKELTEQLKKAIENAGTKYSHLQLQYEQSNDMNAGKLGKLNIDAASQKAKIEELSNQLAEKDLQFKALNTRNCAFALEKAMWAPTALISGFGCGYATLNNFQAVLAQYILDNSQLIYLATAAAAVTGYITIPYLAVPAICLAIDIFQGINDALKALFGKCSQAAGQFVFSSRFVALLLIGVVGLAYQYQAVLIALLNAQFSDPQNNPTEITTTVPLAPNNTPAPAPALSPTQDDATQT